jgi:phosphoserine phosphatase RsbU/P
MTATQRENENLRRILDVTRYMAITNDLDVLLGTIVEATCEVLGCERATIFLFDASRNELYSRVAKDVETIRFPADRGIAGAAAMGRMYVNVPDAYADKRFNPEVDRKTGFRTRNLLTFPLENLSGDLIGVLQALNKSEGPFSADDEELARVLSAQAGVALERGKLIEEYAEKQRMARDLDIARNIQRGLLPKTNPTLPGYEIAGWSQSADETGGDCYDFVTLSDGRLAIFLADATGHGIGAALVIAEARSLVRAMLSVSDDLLKVFTHVNQLLSLDLSDDCFVTAFVGILDPRTHRVEYVSGGQGPLLLLLSTGQTDTRNANALPLAVVSDMQFTRRDCFELPPGATLALLTDGFFEAYDRNSDLFGEDRAVAFLRERVHEPLERLVEGLYDAVRAFSAGMPQADDMTGVLVRRSAE